MYQSKKEQHLSASKSKVYNGSSDRMLILESLPSHRKKGAAMYARRVTSNTCELRQFVARQRKNPREMDKLEERRRHLCRIGANKRRTLGHFGIVPPPLPRKRATGKMWNKYILRYLTLGNHHLLASSPSAGNTKILAVSFHKPNSLLMCVFFSLSLSQIIKWVIIKKRSGQVKPRYATTRSTPGRNRNNNRTVTAADEPMVP